jgi:hypothetical protein
MFGQDRFVSIRATTDPIIIDGMLTENAWAFTDVADQFQMHFPFDTIGALSQTTVRLLYNKTHLYISAVCTHQPGKDYVLQSLKRDFEFEENDAFGIYINAFNDQTNGLYFAVNPFGVQSDGLIADGGVKGVSLNWDGLWRSEVSHANDHWIVEIAIPFKTLRFKDRQKQWRINFARNDQVQNEISTWSPVPRAYDVSVLSRAGILEWISAPEQPVNNIAIIPYFSSGTIKDYQKPSGTKKLIYDVGVDAKMALSSSLNLDVSVNPDFSQVEVDQQKINLQRFELFFPEKRLLFLENSDLFANLGNSRVRPFFSRRIGIEQRDLRPILFGARLSGNVDNNWRIGLMTIQTKANQDLGIKSNNYSVATIQRNIFKGSNITGFVINRQAVREFYTYQNDFNRVIGLEYDLRSPDSRWNGKAFYHQVITPEKYKDAKAISAKLRYRDRNSTLFLGLDHIGENYVTDLGFVPRLYHTNEGMDTTIRVGHTHFRANGHYRFFAPKNSVIDFWGPTFHSDLYTSSSYNYQEHNNEVTLLLRLKNTSSFELLYTGGAPRLLFPFTLDGLEAIFPAGNYPMHRLGISYDTGKQRRFFGKARFDYGGAFLGDQFSFATEVNYRHKYYVVLGLTAAHEELMHFPEEYGRARFTLIGSKIEISFNRNLFFTTFVQYNTQTNNFNINSKFNWRFRPMSDLFLVYTENYTSTDLDIKDRAFVLKFNYWIGGE